MLHSGCVFMKPFLFIARFPLTRKPSLVWLVLAGLIMPYLSASMIPLCRPSAWRRPSSIGHESAWRILTKRLKGNWKRYVCRWGHGSYLLGARLLKSIWICLWQKLRSFLKHILDFVNWVKQSTISPEKWHLLEVGKDCYIIVHRYGAPWAFILSDTKPFVARCLRAGPSGLGTQSRPTSTSTLIK